MAMLRVRERGETSTHSPAEASPRRRPPAAVRAGVIGNYVDQLHIFLPLTALTPVLPRIAGTEAIGATAAIVMIATLLGRPLGSIVFGWMADRVGRVRTTRLALAGTAAASLTVALVPDASVLGGATIVIIIAARFLGGAFLAGEYSAAIPLAMEWSPPGERGRWSGRIMAASPLAQASIAAATAFLVLAFGIDAYAAWGWRTLFAVGALATLLMLWQYVRSVRDAHAPVSSDETTVGSPVPDVLPSPDRFRFWRLFLLMTGLWFLTQVVVIQLTGRHAGELGRSATEIAILVVVASLVQAGAMALAGALSDRFGRRPVFLAFALASGFIAPVLWFGAISPNDLAVAVAAAAILQAVTVAAYGPVGAYLAESFPARVRSFGYGAAYSVSLIVPALHPFYLPLLEAPFGHDGAPVALIVLGALCLGLGAWRGERPGQATRLDVEAGHSR